jgi:Fe-S-cluster containining protein
MESISPPLRSSVEEAAKTDPNSLYFHCRICPKENHCCYRAPTIVVLPEEAKVLIERTQRPDLLVEEGDGFFSIKKDAGDPCPFLTHENLCGVYAIRPIDCRSWPLTLNTAANPQEQLIEDVGCPPVQQNKLTSGFEKAAQAILSKIPAKYRRTFVALVHRDFADAILVRPHSSEQKLGGGLKEKIVLK